MNYDPYIENSILKNKLGVKDEITLKQLEKEITDLEIEKILNSDISLIKTDYNFFLNIHKRLFSDLYSWAGKLRTINISKTESVLNNNSIIYTSHDKIEKYLKHDIDLLNSIPWSSLSLEKKAYKMADIITNIWEIHPFRDGNTRTILTFASILAKKNNFELNLIGKDNIRDIFVKAIYLKDKNLTHIFFLNSIQSKTV